jgi:HK97 family phage prohead protease
MQIKSNPLDLCQLKFDSSSSGEFEGYASVFNSNDAVNDTILKGAFSESLASGVTPKMFLNHEHRAIPLGDWLHMKEDDYGLFAVGKIDLNHKDGPSAYSALKRGALDGISVGFKMDRDGYEWKEDNKGRVIKKADLFEASIVSFPAEGLARISDVKSLIEAVDDLKSLEAFLRDEGGLSRAAAKSLVGRMKQLTHRDDEDELRKTIAEKDALIEGLKKHIATINGQLLALKIGGR